MDVQARTTLPAILNRVTHLQTVKGRVLSHAAATRVDISWPAALYHVLIPVSSRLHSSAGSFFVLVCVTLAS